MRNVFLIKCLVVTLFFSKLVLASTAVVCTPAAIKIQNKNLVLPGVEAMHGPAAHISKIYFLHNISKKSLWIDHPLEGRQSTKAGWSSFVQPTKWSAIITNRKEFAISCAIIEPGKVNYQDCSKVITVCAPQDAQHDLKRKGSYWLVEDKSYDELLVGLAKRGVVFSKAAAAVLDNKKVKADAKKPKEESKKVKEGPKRSQINLKKPSSN